jgi:beta-N-acetylhexosaminidase
MAWIRTGAAITALTLACFAQTDHTPAARAIVKSQGGGIAQQWMRSLSLRDRVAQLIAMPCYGENPSTRSQDYKKFRHSVRDLHVGGLIVVNRVANGSVRNADPYAMAVFLNKMQRLARIPLLVSADFERGASMRVSDTTKFPHNMAYGAARDYEGSRFEGAHTAVEARALGVHWVFAPDSDVNNNPDNPIINIRSYGEDPQDVARHVTAYIEGAHSDPKSPVLVTAKHFPGHGDTAVDTHLGLARLDVGKDRLNAVEWVPFRAAIQSGVDAVMSAHIALPAIEPEEIPSTVSEKVLSGVLRGELGFKGIIVTDAMDMQGLTNQFSAGEASVRAIEAGADVLLMPKDADEAIAALMKAVRSGRISRKRIDQSVARVLGAKVRLGLARRRIVDVNAIADSIQSTEAEERAQQTADRAVTLVRNEGGHFPLANPDRSCLFVLLEARYSQQGRQLIQEVRKRSQKMQVRTLDPFSPESELKDSVDMAGSCDAAVVAAWVTAGAYRGNVALPGPLASFVNDLSATRTPLILMSFGNPYLLRSFPTVASYVAMFSTVPTSETSAVKALFGEVPISGRLPVTIPGFAKIGDGIQIPLSRSSN